MRHRGRFAAALVLCSLCSMALASPHSSLRAEERSAETLFIDAQKALARGDDGAAEALLAQSLARDPSFVSAVWQLAQIHESRGNLDRAREYLARGLIMDPGASWARERLAALDSKVASSILSEARARLVEGDFESAGRHLDRARSIDSTNPAIGPLRAEMEKRLRAKRVDRLVKNAERVLAETQPDGSDTEREALRSILAEDPQHSWALEKLRELDERETAPPPPALPEPSPGAGEPLRDSISAAVPAAVPAAPPSPAPERTLARAEEPARPAAARRGLFLWFLLPALAAAAAGVVLFCLRQRAASRSYPLQGSISLVPMIDLVALLCANRRTGLLAVAGDGAAGEIYFASGEIANARCGNLSGKKAFHRLMEIRSGSFHFHNRLPTTRRTITEPLSTLLLSMKPHDETEPLPGGKPPERETAGARR